jgi:hypothetical protein
MSTQQQQPLSPPQQQQAAARACRAVQLIELLARHQPEWLPACPAVFNALWWQWKLVSAQQVRVGTALCWLVAEQLTSGVGGGGLRRGSAAGVMVLAMLAYSHNHGGSCMSRGAGEALAEVTACLPSR